MTLAKQISLLSDEELVHQLASVCGWEERQEGACRWYVNLREGGKIVSGDKLTHDYTILNALLTLNKEQEQLFADYVDDRTVTRFDMITVSPRIKAEAILFAHTKFCP